MSFLTIYHSSAGSGKTTKLTEEYLKLLFANPENYRHILAVTFTNKATNEMKNRIISELHTLSKNNNKAKEILQSILHNYSFFSVSTIDSFFQKVIRGFAKETGLQAGYNIELDDDKVLQEAVDKLLLEIGQDKLLTQWLIRFAEGKIDEGKHWNFRRDILILGKELFKERFKRFNKKIKNYNKEFLLEFRNQLYEKRKEFENEMSDIGKKGLKLMEDKGIEMSDFSYPKESVANYFKESKEKIDFKPFKRAKKAYNNLDRWYKKDSPKKEIISAIYDDLNELLGKALNYYKKYNTIKHIFKNFHSLGILIDLLEKIRSYCDEKNVFLISDSSEFLKEITKNTDSPFIYEKIGTTYKYYMIDEFQDTSGFQWENFMPLIKNSLSQGYHNLIVGDIKQSIYRWRNGKWELLHNQIEKDIEPFKIEKEILNINWRSKKNIVYFNNALFAVLPRLLQDKFNKILIDEIPACEELKQFSDDIIISVYNEIQQKLPPTGGEDKHGGYIYFEFLEKNNPDNYREGNPDLSGQGWKERVKLKLTNEIIPQLREKFHLKDIAILVRTNAEAEDIANYLLENQIDVISRESLFLKNATSVRIIIAALKYLINPENLINNAELLYKLYKISYFEKKNIKLSALFESASNPDLFISAFSGVEKQNILKKLSLYECVEELIGLFYLNRLKGEYPYLQAFQDCILDYTRNESVDIVSFIDWWDDFGVKKTVNISELQEAIRIMTIHQAKGLEFKAVIIPFCNWNIDHIARGEKKEILWCGTDGQETPFNQLNHLPLIYENDLADTIFTEDYFNEKLHTYIDNLNLLYVAFTRAKEALYCFSDLPKKDKYESGSVQISVPLYEVFNNSKLDTSLLTNYTWDGKILKTGELISTDVSVSVQKKQEPINIRLEEY